MKFQNTAMFKETASSNVVDPLFLYIDLFCGAGGTTTGIVQAEMEGQGIAKVIACVNHDPVAIQSHWKNHPDVKHFEEDIRTLDLTLLIKLVNEQRRKYPNAYIVLWASLECTNFSKAKGGAPRDADSRTLADHLERYVIALDPHYVQIENVVEFMSWGPLCEKGKPISRKNGLDWLRWRREICEMGYYDDWKELNSANFGAYTSRNRLFGCFAKHSLPIAWPQPTHAKCPSKNGLYGDLLKWNPVREVLDFDDEGESIFSRKIPLVDRTLERIYAGLVKFVAGEISPAGVRKTNFLASYYGNGHNITSIDNPCPTLTTKDRVSIVQPKYFLDQQYGKSKPASINDVAATLTNNPKLALVGCDPFIMPTNYNNGPKSIDEPLQTITANRKHHYLINPAWGGNIGSVDKPCCTIVARQDKAPLYFVGVETGQLAIAIFDCDTEIMIKIKEFMVAYGIVDIKMRMLRIPELLEIQGFPKEYQLQGTQTHQKKFIGNSVVPQVVKAWVEAMAMKMIEHLDKVAA